MYFTPGLYIVLSVCRSHWKFLNYQNYSLCISCIVSEIFRWPERSPEDERRLIGGQERRRQIDTVGENGETRREWDGSILQTLHLERCAPESLEASSKHYTVYLATSGKHWMRGRERNGGREMENRQGERRTFAEEQTMLGEGNHQRVREMRRRQPTLLLGPIVICGGWGEQRVRPGDAEVMSGFHTRAFHCHYYKVGDDTL